jgi:hypothetical protein
MVMDRSTGIFIRSRGPNVAFVADNIFAEPGTILTGDGKLDVARFRRAQRDRIARGTALAQRIGGIV